MPDPSTPWTVVALRIHLALTLLAAPACFTSNADFPRRRDCDAERCGGDSAAPGGDSAVPDGDTSALGGDTSAPGGDTLAPGGDSIAPGGDSMAPGGDAFAAPPILRLAPAAAVFEMDQGASASMTLNATLSTADAATVTFSAQELPAGVSAAFDPSSCALPCATTVTLTAGASMDTGPGRVVLHGSSGAASAGRSVHLLVSPGVDPTRTLHVALSGDDAANDCTAAHSSATPKRSLAAALACVGTAPGAGAGFTVMLHAGRYQEVVESWAMPGGTSWAAPFAVRGAPGEGPVEIWPAATPGFLMSLNAPDNCFIVLDRAVLDAGGSPYGAVRLDASSHHVRLQNLLIRNSSGAAVVTDGPDHELLALTILGAGVAQDATALAIASRGTRVERCDVSGSGLYGIQVYAGAPAATDGTVVRYNRIHGHPNQGILLGCGADLVAEHNILWNNGIGISVALGGVRDARVLHNTMVANTGLTGECIIVDSAATATVVRNNLCWQNLADIIDGAGDSLVEGNLIGIDPLFRDALADDFRLSPGSPAIDAGVTLPAIDQDFDGVLRPQGAGYDAGAYELEL